MKKQIFTASGLAFALGLTFLSPIIEVQAFTPEIPHTLIYEGRLLSKTSTPLSGDYIMRFSLWNTTDIVSGEINSDGSLNTAVACFPILFNPSTKPIETVVLPSPAGVGVKAVTKIKLFCFIFSSSIKSKGSLALYFPYISKSFSLTANFFAISFM